MRVFTLVTLWIAAFPLSPLAAQCPTTALDAVATDIADGGLIAGRKDLALSIEPMKVGTATYFTGDLQGGYFNFVAPSSASMDYPPPPPGICAGGSSQSVISQAVYTSPTVPTGVYGQLFLNEHMFFSYVGTPTEPVPDLDVVLPPNGASNLFVTQNTILSPTWDGTSFGVYGFPILTGQIAPQLPARDAWLVQNIGLGSHPGIACGEFQFNYENALIDKWLARAINYPPYGALVGSPTLLLGYPTLSPVDQDVADKLEESIVDRVQAYAASPAIEKRVAYQAIGGEYFVAIPPKHYLCYDEDEGTGTTVTSYAEYKDALAVTDYSADSIAHFRKWLEIKRYPTGIAALNQAWGMPTGGQYASFAEPEPLLAVGNTNHQKRLEDWRAFQTEQWELEVPAFQYGIAKRERPDMRHFQLSFGLAGAEHAALHTDGMASGNWYGNDSSVGMLLSPAKRLALHAQTYGESINLPLFAMPRETEFVSGGCKIKLCGNLSSSGDPIPPTAESPCYDEDASYRTLRELLALGVDTLGIGYWENVTYFSNKDSKFEPEGCPQPCTNYVYMPEALAAEAESWRDERAFMTPWHSPLLVHVGSGAGQQGAMDCPPPPPASACAGAAECEAMLSRTDKILRLLSSEHAQYAPFGDPLAYDDLWAGSQRKVLLSASVAELRYADVRRYRDEALAHGWEGVVVVTTSAAVATFPAGWMQSLGLIATAPTPPGPCLTYYVPNPLGPPPVPIHILAYCATWSDAQVLNHLSGWLVQIVENLAGTTVRPVRALHSSSGVALSELDLNVMTDGANLLVSLANVGAMDAPTSLQVALPTFTGVSGWSTPVGLNVLAGKSAIAYLSAVMPGLGSVQSCEYGEALQFARGKVDFLHNKHAAPANFATEAAYALLDQLDALPAGSYPEKKAAGLARLRRMLFVRHYVSGVRHYVEVRDWLDQPVPGAIVQVEFALQHHHRVDAGVTDGTGKLQISVTPPNVPTWDFRVPAYVTPGAGTNVLEIDVQHPETHAHSVHVVSGV